MYVLSIYRPEADDHEPRHVWHSDAPFAGVEILAVSKDEDVINAVIDEYQKRAGSAAWFFHIDSV